jgi:oxygen-independent coproporphyrinogen-3 oxidase
MGHGAQLAALRPALQEHPLIAGRARREAGRPGPGLYLHVPFCRVRCPYCDFATAPYAAAAAGRFVRAVCAEAALVAPALEGVAFETLSLGGGTPSRLEADDLAALVGGVETSLALAPHAERSLEANPEDVGADRLSAWEEAGITRVSVGVQSFDPVELGRLGRPHDAARAEAALGAVAERFPSWSADLLYAFPGHTLDSWRVTLERALALAPPHLSLYHFTAEPGTILGEAVRAGRLAAPSDDAAAEFFDLGARLLGEAGLEHYEISNFARPGHRSRHNLNYWKSGDTLGLGPAAVSTWGEWRWKNARHEARHAAAVLAGRPALDEVEHLAGRELAEIFLTGLRLAEGVPWERLAGHEPEARAWGRAARLLGADGLLVVDGSGIRVPASRRRLTDAIVVRLWQAAESQTALPRG